MSCAEVCDFSRSFLHFRIDVEKKPPKTVSHKPPFTVNNVRVPVECRLSVVEKATGQEQVFVLTSNCKTERVGVERDIWTEPNADVTFVMSQQQFLIIKTWDHCGRKVMLHPPSLGAQPQRQVGSTQEAFDRLRIDLRMTPGERLDQTDRIVAAILASEPLVARTRMENDRYDATIEYPIKTVNASERDHYYQTDTGPILFPDLDRPPHELIEGLELAFVAHNSPDWAEFILQAPTPIRDGIDVHHYSKPVRRDVQNQVFRCGDGC